MASGPGKDQFESTQIIGQRQFAKAKQLFDSATVELNGSVKYIHQTINMSDVVVELPDKTSVKTCPSAMGYSFAAGTTDGPGAFDFHQGNISIRLIQNLNLRSNSKVTHLRVHSGIWFATY